MVYRLDRYPLQPAPGIIALAPFGLATGATLRPGTSWKAGRFGGEFFFLEGEGRSSETRKNVGATNKKRVRSWCCCWCFGVLLVFCFEI